MPPLQQEQLLHLRRLRHPDVGKLLLRLQGGGPQIQTDDQAEEGGQANHPARELEPSTRRGGKRRQSDAEGDEGHDGVGNASCVRVSPNELISPWPVFHAP